MEIKEKAQENTKTIQPKEAAESDAKQKRTYKKWVKVVTIVGVVIAVALIALLLYPVVISFTSAAEEEFFAYVEKMGIFGYAALYVMQVLQVVIAIIPGGVVQFAVGYMFNPWFGLAVCMAGIYTGQLIIFRLVRRFGHNLVEAVADGEKLKKWSFIRNQKKLELLTFILFVIPGMPKDLLCYIFPLSTIDENRFMFISVIARIPAIISSIYAADYFREGDYITAGIIWGVIMLISGGAILATSKLMARREKKGKNSGK